MKIERMMIGDHQVSIANDQADDSEPPCWKTKIDEGMWSFGRPTRDKAMADVRGELAEMRMRQLP